MSIVRSLLISIGFVNDKKAINETNKAITGFKTRFALAATTASYALKIVKDFFSSVAAATLDTDELARSMGYSLKQVVALQQGFQKFRINDSQASAILQTLQKDLDEFSQGYGRLRALMRDHGLEIPKNATPLELFDTILKYLQKIDNEVIRSQIANIFFPGLGIKISDLAVNMNEFKESVDGAYEALKKTPDIKEDLRDYEQSVNSITRSLWDLFKIIIVTVGPAVRELSEYLQQVVRFYNAIFTGDFSTLKSSLSTISDQFTKLGDGLFNKVEAGIKSITGYFNPYVQFDPNAPKASLSNGVSYNWMESMLPASWVNYVNNQVEINVPAGTTQEQTQYLGTQIERLISDSINATFQDIQYNNPQVE